jgi:ribosomal protein L12E/L44/L45/RPP1/RPP2
MRAGLLVSLIGHIGAVLMTTLMWEVRSQPTPEIMSVVPVEIVDVAVESNVRALAEDVPDEEVVARAEETTTPAAAEAAAAPPSRARAPQNDDFDLASIARMINTDSKTGRTRAEGQRAERTQVGSGLGTAEVAALEDRARTLARAHLRRCWRMPVDLPDPDRLVVTVAFDLNRNGTLNGAPRVVSPRGAAFDPAMRTAIEAALRAVRVCDPYPFPDDPVVGEHYDIWRHTEFVFRPSF